MKEQYHNFNYLGLNPKLFRKWEEASSLSLDDKIRAPGWMR